MAQTITDAQIQELIEEPKQLPENYKSRLESFRAKRGHREAELSIVGSRGSRFRVLVRVSDFDQFNFSVVLSYLPPSQTRHFRLRRYNGRHQHTNRIECETLYGFHIHEATERYQKLGASEDAFARETDAYENPAGAIRELVTDCGFVEPESEGPAQDELPLFSHKP